MPQTHTHRVHEWKQGDVVNSLKILKAGMKEVNEMLRHWPWVLSQLRGLQQRRIGNPLGGPGQWLAKISGNTSLGTNQWGYSAEEWKKNGIGYGGFTIVTGGRTATSGQVDQLRNFREEGNTGTGVEMNGVDHSGSSFTDTNFAMVPAPTGVFVVVHEITFVPSADALDLPTDPPLPAHTERWFEYENADDGTC